MKRDLILLAEDDEAQAALAVKAFERTGLANPIFVVNDGDEVIDYLTGRGKYADRDDYPLPNLLLLDLKMPNKDGFEVLEWIRRQPDLKRLRVVVLTDSKYKEDINRAYELGANSYLVKPVGLRDFVSLAEAIKGYWIWLSEPPEVKKPKRAFQQASRSAS
jgi:CheY-like chemotaxis protein